MSFEDLKKKTIPVLYYISYATNRDKNPEISPQRWAKIYPNAHLLEKKYQREKKLNKKP